MKKDELPQDPGPLGRFTRELSYVVNEDGKYVAEKSIGWKVKTTALDVAWKDVEKRVEEAIRQVKAGQASPLLYYMERRLMTPEITASYMGLWTWQVKRHLKPAVFSRLPGRKLEKYAELFEITVEDLKCPDFLKHH